MNKATRVPPEGDPLTASIVLVGEQPGRMETFAKRPFVGPAGKELDKCLQIAGISRYDCYLTNVIKDLDLPLDCYIKFGKNDKTVVTEEGNVYIKMLQEELMKTNANVIVPVGNVALYALSSRRGINSWRGSIIESTLLPGRKLIPIIHPATIIPPKNVYTNERLLIYDLKRAKRESEFPEINLAIRNVTISPTFMDAMTFISKCIEIGLSGGIIDCDIEVYNDEVSCISLAYSEHDAISIPFIDAQGDYFSIDHEIEIWKALATLLEDKRIKKRGQNFCFDMAFLIAKNKIRVHNSDDTMIKQKLILPDYPASLDFITSITTDIPYYKNDGKRWFRKGGRWETLWQYNGMDSISTAAATPEQDKMLRQQDNIQAYERQNSIAEPLVYMMTKGIKVDVEGMQKERMKKEEELAELQEKLNTIAGMELNANSPSQLVWYFYEKLGHKPYKNKGRVTTDETALKRLSRKGVEEANIIGKMRSLRKLASTYVNIDKVDDDGRIRCSYNPAGTVSGRLSSSENIFGKGMNMQNWPHDLMKYLLADDGYVFYSFDLSQIENRIVAYAGKVTRMIDAFENGKDLHTLTASLIFQKPVDEISDEAGSSSIGDGSKSERFWGKKSNHSFNYDLGYRSFALQMEMQERQSKWLVEQYHAAYPEVRGQYHQMVRNRLSENRTLANLYGRKRLFSDRWGDDMFKEAYSYIPQSTTADKMNKEGLSYIYNDKVLMSPVELLIQIHDSIGFQIPINIGWKRHAEILTAIKDSLETPLRVHGMDFKVPADLVIGLNLYKDQGREIKHKNFPNTTDKLAIKLEEIYNDLSKTEL